MNELLETVLARYGGIDAWKSVNKISAHRVFGGALWDIKQVGDAVAEGEVTVDIQTESTSLSPFTGANLRSAFTPNKVSIVDENGTVTEELYAPRESFAGHDLMTPWTPLQLAYFTGYAMWTYLAEPYSLTFPGVITEEGETWDEGGETWRRLHVTYPASIATHSTKQTLYIDADGLIRRRDYEVDIAGGSPAAHYVSGFTEVNGITVPTSRLIYVRDENNKPMHDQLVVAIELTNIQVN